MPGPWGAWTASCTYCGLSSVSFGNRKKKGEGRVEEEKEKRKKEKDKRWGNSHFTENKKEREKERKQLALTFLDVLSCPVLYKSNAVFHSHFTDDGGTRPAAMKGWMELDHILTTVLPLLSTLPVKIFNSQQRRHLLTVVWSVGVNVQRGISRWDITCRIVL